MEETLQEVECDLTENQKASLLVYQQNRMKIDQMLDRMSEGLSDLKVEVG